MQMGDLRVKTTQRSKQMPDTTRKKCGNVSGLKQEGFG